MGSVDNISVKEVRVVFVKDVAIRDGRLMKLVHCSERLFDEETRCEIGGAAYDEWRDIEEVDGENERQNSRKT